MRTGGHLTRAAGLLGLAIVLAAGGCGRKDVSARVQPPRVTKWKHAPESATGIPKGIVVEQHGEGGPHLSVPFDAKASRLAAQLTSSGANQAFQFARHQE